MAEVPRTSDPAGSSTLTSMAPGLPNRDRFLGVRTVSRPPEQVTWVCRTARTSLSSEPLRGSTSTTVSVRLPAVMRAVPTSSSMVAEIGSGVSKEGMAVPFSWLGWVIPLVRRVMSDVGRIGDPPVKEVWSGQDLLRLRASGPSR